MRRLNPTAMAIIAGVAILLLLAFLFARGGNGDQDRLTDDQVTAAGDRRPDERCGSQATYDAIKTELFRRAAETRGSDQAAFDQLARFASLRVERPLLESHDESVGTLRCTGRVSLDLPPGVAVVGGRRTLSADVDYVLQPAADNSGDVVLLEGAQPIIVPLATLARSGNNVPLPGVQPGPADPQDDLLGPYDQEPPALPETPEPPSAPVVEPEPAPEPQRTTASPSFNCRNARTRGEIAVCNDGGLAALDRQMAAQYGQAVSSASPAQRAILQRTRGDFLRFRDNCPSEACIAETYRGRIREIRDIMSGRWQPPR